MTTSQVRLTPSRALRVILEKLCAMTGASVDECLIRRRGSTVDTARNLALHFLVEVERYPVTKLALAFPPDAKTGKPRHWTSPRNNHIQGWELREATRPLSDELFDWLRLHWRDPIGAHRTALAKRARAFQAAIAAAEAQRGSKRLEATDLAAAVAAMIRAKPFLVAPPNAPPLAPRTAVPIVDDTPAPLRVLRMAPALARIAALDVRAEPSGAGVMITAHGDAPAQKVGEWMRHATRILDAMGFPAFQQGAQALAKGFAARIYVAPVAAAVAAIVAAIHMAAPARILSPIDGAPNGSHGPAFATA